MEKLFYRNPTSIHSLNPRSQAFLSPFSERKDFLVPNACETRWKNTTIPLHVPIPSSGARCDALHFFVSKLARQHRKIHAIAATAADPKFDQFFQRSRCKLNTHKLVFLWHLTQPYVCPPRRQHKNLWKKNVDRLCTWKHMCRVSSSSQNKDGILKKIIQWLDADENIILKTQLPLKDISYTNPFMFCADYVDFSARKNSEQKCQTVWSCFASPTIWFCFDPSAVFH